MQQETHNDSRNEAGGTLEHSGHCASQSRETISLTYMLRQQPPLDVEVHAPRSLLASPLPPSNTHRPWMWKFTHHALSSRLRVSSSPFMSKENTDQILNIPLLSALSSAMRLLQRYEFKNNHGEWITAVKPDLSSGISERVSDALRTTGENIDTCYSVKRELHDALAALLGKDVTYMTDSRHASANTSGRARDDGHGRFCQLLEPNHLDDTGMIDERSLDDVSLERAPDRSISGQTHQEGSWIEGEPPDGLGEGGVDVQEVDSDGEDRWRYRDIRDGKIKYSEHDDNVRDDSSRRHSNHGWGRSKGKGRVTEGTVESDSILSSPGSGSRLVQGRRDRSVMRNTCRFIRTWWRIHLGTPFPWNWNPSSVNTIVAYGV